MLKIVIENPIQFTIVSAVPLSFLGTFNATKVENRGEPAITTIPQKSKKSVKRASFSIIKREEKPNSKYKIKRV